MVRAALDTCAHPFETASKPWMSAANALVIGPINAVEA